MYCIVHILADVDSHTVPRKKCNFYKFWWDVEATKLKQASLEAHRLLWVAAGRPRVGDVFQRMQAAKLQYKRCLRKLQRENLHVISDDLNDLLLDRFWKVLKSKFGGGRRTQSPTLNGLAEESAIAACFADHFSEVCKPNSIEHDKYLRADFSMKFADYSGNWFIPSVDEDVVAECISRLQRGKAPGLDGIMAEHVLYAHPVISTVLARLFTAMLNHGYVPQAFGLGVVIPILKDDSLNCKA